MLARLINWFGRDDREAGPVRDDREASPLADREAVRTVEAALGAFL